MPDRPTILAELIDLAPRTDLTIIRIVAELLAGQTSSDVLFLVADSLRARAVELSIDNHHSIAGELRAIERVLITEATHRALPLRGSFW